TGSSEIGMASIDKALSKRAVSRIGFPGPRFAFVPTGRKRIRHPKLNFPAIIKPRSAGAPVGLTLGSVLHSENELIRRAREIHQKLGEPAICEQYIDGPELSVGLIEDKSGVLVLPIRETIFGRAEEGGPRFCTERVKDNHSYRDRWGIRYRRA